MRTKRKKKLKRSLAEEGRYSIRHDSKRLNTSRMVVDKVAIRRRLCRESYWDFCQEFWPTVIAEELVGNWHMRIMAKAFQDCLERVFRGEPKEYDLIFNVPPGTSKSSICSLLSLPWCWTRMPSLRFLGGSWDADLALDLGNKSRRVIRSRLYQETFPDIEITKDQDTKGFFGNYHGGERRATSTGASIIGRHSHVQVIDDPINPAGVRSEADLDSANTWIRETLPARCVDQSVTPQIMVMQRLSIDDPTGMRLARKGGTPVKHYCFPAEVSDLVKPRRFRKKYKHGLLEPRRLPKRVLENKMIELGSYGYAGQFAQSPVPLTGGMFQTEQIVLGTPPPIAEFERVIRWWDKAATAEGDGAFTSGVLMGMLRNKDAVPRFWILDVVRGRWDTHKREMIIRQTADRDYLKYGPKYEIGVEQEPGSGGKDSAQWTVRKLAGYKVRVERATGDKLERAVPYSDQVNAGNVGLWKRGEWVDAYMSEMMFCGPGCKFMDQIDSSSAGFNRIARQKLIAGGAGF